MFYTEGEYGEYPKVDELKNLMFQFEGEGKDLKLVGIKEIDNDMSLGLAGPGMDLGIKCLPAISNIGIISKEIIHIKLLCIKAQS